MCFPGAKLGISRPSLGKILVSSQVVVCTVGGGVQLAVRETGTENNAGDVSVTLEHGVQS